MYFAGQPLTPPPPVHHVNQKKQQIPSNLSIALDSRIIISSPVLHWMTPNPTKITKVTMTAHVHTCKTSMFVFENVLEVSAVNAGVMQ